MCYISRGGGARCQPPPSPDPPHSCILNNSSSLLHHPSGICKSQANTRNIQHFFCSILFTMWHQKKFFFIIDYELTIDYYNNRLIFDEFGTIKFFQIYLNEGPIKSYIWYYIIFVQRSSFPSFTPLPLL